MHPESGSENLGIYFENEIMTAMSGIYNVSGDVIAVVAMDISMLAIQDNFFFMLINMGGITFAVVVAACFSYYFFVRKRVIKPLFVLKKAAVGLVDTMEKEPEKNIHINVHTGDEIEEVARSFEEMEKRLKVYIRENEEAAAEKERIATEMGLARNTGSRNRGHQSGKCRT